MKTRKTLRNKVLGSLLAVGIGSMFAYNTYAQGKDTGKDETIVGSILEGASVYSKDGRAGFFVGAIGRGLREVGRNKAIANSGDNITINVNEQNQRQQEKIEMAYRLYTFVDENGDGIGQVAEWKKEFKPGDEVIAEIRIYYSSNNEDAEMRLINGGKVLFSEKGKTVEKVGGLRKTIEIKESDRGKYFEVNWKIGNSGWMNHEFKVK